MTRMEYLTVTEVAKRLHVSTAAVRGWIASGDLPALLAGRTYRITTADLDAYLTRHRGTVAS